MSRKIPQEILDEICSQIRALTVDQANDQSDFRADHAVEGMIEAVLKVDPAQRALFVTARDDGLALAAEPQDYEPCNLFEIPRAPEVES